MGGGVAMGMGYALRKRYRVENCKPLEKYGSLGLFRADELSKITSIIVEKPGLKISSSAIETGEITSIPAVPVISNAYYHWNHVRHHELSLLSTPTFSVRERRRYCRRERDSSSIRA